MASTAKDITRLLNDDRKDPGREEELYRLVASQFRRLARGQMRGEPDGQSVESMMLVDDAFMKLVRGTERPWQNRLEFFAAAANVMRQIRVDHARRRLAQKRGGGERGHVARQDLARRNASQSADPAEIVAVHEVVSKLESRHPDVFRIFHLHYYGGWELREIADVILEMPYTTVKRRWGMAKAFIHRELSKNA